MQRMIEPMVDDKILQKDIERYLKQVSRCLHMSRKDREHYMRNFYSAVEEFVAMTPDIDIDKIIQHFGTPRKVSDVILSENPPATLREKLYRYTVGRILLILLVIVILGAGAVFVVERILYAANGNPIAILENPHSISYSSSELVWN